MTEAAFYSIGTYDWELGAYTPQIGVDRWHRLTKWELRVAIRQLRSMGYTCHRRRDIDGSYDDNDTNVIVDRTDDMTVEEVIKSWER